MSVHINDKGEMVITMRCLDKPSADYIALRTSIVHLLQNRDQDDLPTFHDYRVAELLKELELTPEQAELALTKNS